MAYLYKDIPLSPTSAAKFIIEKLQSAGRPVKRADIATYVIQRHEELGGLPTLNPVATTKKALQNLSEEGRIRGHGGGFYSLLDMPVCEPPSEMPAAQNEPEIEHQIVPEEILGDGSETVYVYFSESDRELAVLKGQDYWPCKVGFTASSLQSRILGQGVATSMARLPIVGLVIKTSSGQRLERAIHFALDEADARMDGAAGTEWFESSPTRIKTWYLAHCEMVHMLGKNLSNRPDE